MTRPAEPDTVLVTVVRTGGIAGMRREWRAAPAADDTPQWVALIDDCPWDAPPKGPPLGADLFVWRITARFESAGDAVERDAELQDPQIAGPWQALIDAVRTASADS
jgi:hypothetical protein